MYQQVRRAGDEPLFNSLIEDTFSAILGYEQPVGEQLKYLVWAQGRPIACMAWSSAPRHLGSRDRFIGWSGEARWRNIRYLAYNTRFLILPWVEVPHLASLHPAGRMARQISQDWERICRAPDLSAGNLHRSGNDSARDLLSGGRTGYCWGEPRGAGRTTRLHRPNLGRSRKCSHFPFTGDFTSYFRTYRNYEARAAPTSLARSSKLY